MQRILIRLAQLLLFVIAIQLNAQCPEKGSLKPYFQNKKIDSLQLLAQLIEDCPEHWDTLALTYHQLGLKYNRQDQFLLAIENTSKALAVRKKILEADHVDIGRSHQNLGAFYQEAEDYYSSKDHLLQAVDIFTRIKSYRLINALLGLNTTYRRMGDFKSAMDYMEIARQKIVELKPKYKSGRRYLYEHGDIENAIGLTEIIRGNYDRAFEALNVADSIFNEIPSYSRLANVHLNFGNAYGELGQLEKAKYHYELSLQHSDQSSSMSKLARAYNNLGVILRKQNQLDEAEQSITTSIKIRQEEGDLFLQSYNYDNLGDIYLARGDHQKALEFYHKAISIAAPQFESSSIYNNPDKDQLNALANKEDVLTYLSDKANAWNAFYIDTEDKKLLQAAIDCYRRADILVDLMRKEHSSQDTRLYWRQQVQPIYEKAIEACYQMNDLSSAFYFMEKSKSVLLLDALQAIDARQLIPDSVAGKELKLKNELVNARLQLRDDIYESASTLNESRQAVLKAQDILHQFLQSLSDTYPEYHKLRYNIEVAPLDVVQSQLVSDSCYLMEYFWGERYLYVFGISPSKSDLKRIAQSPQLDSSIQNFLAAISDPIFLNESPQQFVQLSHELYRQIYAPMLSSFGQQASSAIIIPDHILSFIPFDALADTLDEYTNAPYLIKKQMIRYGYSATVLANQKKSQQHIPAAPNLYGIAPFAGQSSQQYSQLAYSQAEVALLEKKFTGNFQYDREASLAHFKKQAPQCTIVHLSTHANANAADNNSQPEIVFAGDSTLSLSELYATDFRAANLVILSACETGIGKINKGEGVMSLNRGFTYAGAASLISSLWQVKEKSTSEIFEYFYHHLSEGKTKASALHLAKLDYLANADFNMQSPFTWAGLIYLGDDAQLIPAKAGGGLWLWLGLGAALAILVAAFRRRKTQVSTN